MAISSQPARTIIFSAALLAGASLSGPTLAASTGWAPTATLGVPVASLLAATDRGALPGARTVTVRLGLAIQGKAALLSLVRAQTDPKSATYGQFLTPASFTRTFAPTPAQVASVVAYLQSAGFSNITVEPNRLLVTAHGTAAMANAAFNTTLEQVSIGGKPMFINITPAQVPASLGGLVTGVLGLNTVGMMASTVALPTVPQYLVSYTPKQFQRIYSGLTVQPARNATIAIMAEGDMTGVLSDLRIAEAAFGVPQVPVQVVQVGIASPDVAGADEWDMDTQYSTGMAQRVKKLYLYTTTSLTDSDLALEFSHWATDDLAKAASASLGECEIFPYVDGSMAIDDATFLEAASQGQTFFASSGDTGSFCPIGPAGVNGVPAGAPFVNYPAASSYVIGVGGTTLLTNADGTYDSEITWDTGGGGLSQFELTPFWQGAAVAPLSTTGTRGVPDVAMDADPESGALVYVNGAPTGVGGTSLSSPLALGIWARAVSINPKLGFAGPALYGLYNPKGGTGGIVGSYPMGGYHDITAGGNGIYTALPGYDLTTGLGTFQVHQLTYDLRN